MKMVRFGFIGNLLLFGYVYLQAQISITPGTGFNLDGQGSGIYATRPTSADFTTGTNELVLQIVSETNTGAVIDFDADGNREIVVQTVGINATSQTQTRLYIFEAAGNNDFRQRSTVLIDAGNSGGTVGLMRGFDVGNVDGDADIEIVSMSGQSSSSYVTAYDINTSTFVFAELAQAQTFGAGGVLHTTNGTINQIRIVNNKNGGSNNDIIVSNATGSTANTQLFAIEVSGSTFVFVNTTAANSGVNVNGGVIAFDHANMGDASDEEILMVTELAGAALVIREYVSSGTTPFGTAKTISTNWTGTTTGSFTTVSIADIDGDGDLDAASNDYNGKFIRAIRRTGTDTYTTEAIQAVALAANSPATEISDYDNDAKMEIIYSNGTSVVYREHDGTANDFSSGKWGAETTLLSGLGTGTANIVSFVGGSSTTLDNDRNYDVVIGRSVQVTGQSDMDDDEIFILEANRLFTNGSITSGNYDNVEIQTGTVSLGGSTSVVGTLTLTSGYLNLGANNLTLSSAVAGTPTVSNHIVTDGAGKVVKNIAVSGSFAFPVGYDASTYNPVTVALDGASTADDFSVKVSSGVSPAAPDNNAAVAATWDISEGTGGGSNATLTFQWTETQEGGVFSRGTAAAWHYNGSSWANMSGGTTSGSNPYTLTTTSTVSSFSPYIVGNDGALPVEIVSFSATAKGRGVELAWQTATEVNNKGFEVEKNVNGTWNKIGFVEGNGTSNAPKSYSYSDASAKGTVSYRLKQIDNDAKFVYSSEVNATVVVTAADYQLSQNFPNPFNPNTNITFAMKNAEHVNVTVYNSLGQVVATLFNDVAAANQIYSLSFDGKNLSSGTYFYSLRSAMRNEVRKMSLMK